MFYDIKETGKRIGQLRKEMGMTQEAFANALNITDRHLRRVESGEKGASIDLLVTIAVLCGVSLDFLVLGKYREK